MTETKIVGGGDALTCDGCHGWAKREEAAPRWAVATDSSRRHTCANCLAIDRFFLPLVGGSVFTWDDLDGATHGKPKMDRVATGRWLTSAERRGQVLRLPGQDRRYQAADPLPFDPTRLQFVVET